MPRPPDFWAIALLLSVLALERILDLGLDVSDETLVLTAGGLVGLYTLWNGYHRAQTSKAAIQTAARRAALEALTPPKTTPPQ